MQTIKLTPELIRRLISGFALGPAVLFLLSFNLWSFSILFAAAAVITVQEWLHMARSLPSPAKNSILGLLYLALCFGSFLCLRTYNDQGAWHILSLLVCIWSSDVSAYFAGKIIGGPKLAPTISPKKTWAGLGGAMIGCGISLVIMLFLEPVFAYVMNVDTGLTTTHSYMVFLAGCLLGGIGQAGDLFISYFKRKANIKDMGNLIPGHGGLLDRIDSLLLAIPVYLIMVWTWVS